MWFSLKSRDTTQPANVRHCLSQLGPQRRSSALHGDTPRLLESNPSSIPSRRWLSTPSQHNIVVSNHLTPVFIYIFRLKLIRQSSSQPDAISTHSGQGRWDRLLAFVFISHAWNGRPEVRIESTVSHSRGRRRSRREFRSTHPSDYQFGSRRLGHLIVRILLPKSDQLQNRAPPRCCLVFRHALFHRSQLNDCWADR